MLSQTHTSISFDGQEVTASETGCNLFFFMGRWQVRPPLTPANRTMWEGEGHLRAPLLPRMVQQCHISAD